MFHHTRYGHSHIRPTCHGRAGELGRAPQSFKGRVKWEQTPTKKEIDLRIEKDENKHVSGKKETMNQEGQSNIRNRLMGVFVSVLSGGCFILGSISFIEIGYLRHERIIRIGVCEHRADRKQDFGNC